MEEQSRRGSRTDRVNGRDGEEKGGCLLLDIFAAKWVQSIHLSGPFGELLSMVFRWTDGRTEGRG